jgi:replicative DNA helicase
MQAPAPHIRIPPSAPEVEQAVLGAMLLDRRAVAEAAGMLAPEVFYAERHRRLFAAILTMFGEGRPADLVTVTDELRRRGELEAVGGAYYLAELTACVGSSANVEHHARILQEKALLRRFIEENTRLVGEAYDPGADPFTLADEATGLNAALVGGDAGRGRVVAPDELAALAAEPSVFVPTGVAQIDAAITGLMPGRVTVIAARPSQGKTAAALELARRAPLQVDDFGRDVLYFSAEMAAKAIAKRLAAAGPGALDGLTLYIDETARPTTAHMMGRAVSLSMRRRLRFIVFDYLQYTGERAENRRLSFDAALYGCHEIAKRLNVPFLVLAQLNRQMEGRSTQTELSEPQLADLKESGGIEEVAALVLMLHHPWTHWFQRGQAAEDEPDRETFRVFVRKNTHGPLGSATLRFDRTTGRITDPEEDDRKSGRIIVRSYAPATIAPF